MNPRMVQQGNFKKALGIGQGVEDMATAMEM